MEYRIKMIQKNNGDNVFIPQYRNSSWVIESIIKIVLAVPVLFLWVCIDKTSSSIVKYFSVWEDIDTPEKSIDPIEFFLFSKESRFFPNKAVAELIIKNHKEKINEDIKKEKEKEFEKYMNKTKKVLYIKIK